jgi:enolase
VETSAGQHEALELRDGDSKRYRGKGTLKAVHNVNAIIAPKVVGMDCTSQEEVDILCLSLTVLGTRAS